MLTKMLVVQGININVTKKSTKVGRRVPHLQHWAGSFYISSWLRECQGSLHLLLSCPSCPEEDTKSGPAPGNTEGLIGRLRQQTVSTSQLSASVVVIKICDWQFLQYLLPRIDSLLFSTDIPQALSHSRILFSSGGSAQSWAPSPLCGDYVAPALWDCEGEGDWSGDPILSCILAVPGKYLNLRTCSDITPGERWELWWSELGAELAELSSSLNNENLIERISTRISTEPLGTGSLQVKLKIVEGWGQWGHWLNV